MFLVGSNGWNDAVVDVCVGFNCSASADILNKKHAKLWKLLSYYFTTIVISSKKKGAAFRRLGVILWKSNFGLNVIFSNNYCVVWIQQVLNIFIGNQAELPLLLLMMLRMMQWLTVPFFRTLDVHTINGAMRGSCWLSVICMFTVVWWCRYMDWSSYYEAIMIEVWIPSLAQYHSLKIFLASYGQWKKGDCSSQSQREYFHFKKEPQLQAML